MRFLGNKSEGVAAFLLVNMSNVKPGYKNGLILGGRVSGVISSVSLVSIFKLIVSYQSLNDLFMKTIYFTCGWKAPLTHIKWNKVGSALFLNS